MADDSTKQRLDSIYKLLKDKIVDLEKDYEKRGNTATDNVSRTLNAILSALKRIATDKDSAKVVNALQKTERAIFEADGNFKKLSVLNKIDSDKLVESFGVSEKAAKDNKEAARDIKEAAKDIKKASEELNDAADNKKDKELIAVMNMQKKVLDKIMSDVGDFFVDPAKVREELVKALKGSKAKTEKGFTESAAKKLNSLLGSNNPNLVPKKSSSIGDIQTYVSKSYLDRTNKPERDYSSRQRTNNESIPDNKAEEKIDSNEAVLEDDDSKTVRDKLEESYKEIIEKNRELSSKYGSLAASLEIITDDLDTKFDKQLKDTRVALGSAARVARMTSRGVLDIIKTIKNSELYDNIRKLSTSMLETSRYLDNLRGAGGQQSIVEQLTSSNGGEDEPKDKKNNSAEVQKSINRQRGAQKGFIALLIPELAKLLKKSSIWDALKLLILKFGANHPLLAAAALKTIPNIAAGGIGLALMRGLFKGRGAAAATAASESISGGNIFNNIKNGFNRVRSATTAFHNFNQRTAGSVANFYKDFLNYRHDNAMSDVYLDAMDIANAKKNEAILAKPGVDKRAKMAEQALHRARNKKTSKGKLSQAKQGNAVAQIEKSKINAQIRLSSALEERYWNKYLNARKSVYAFEDKYLTNIKKLTEAVYYTLKDALKYVGDSIIHLKNNSIALLKSSKELGLKGSMKGIFKALKMSVPIKTLTSVGKGALSLGKGALSLAKGLALDTLVAGVVVGAVMGAAKPIFDGIKDGLLYFVNPVKSLFTGLVDAGKGLGAALGGILHLFDALWDISIAIGKPIGKLIGTVFGGLFKVVAGIGAAVVAPLATGVSIVGSVLKGLGQAIGGVCKFLGDVIYVIIGLGKMLGNWIANSKLGRALSAIGNSISNWWDNTINAWISRCKEAADIVSKGFDWLHNLVTGWIDNIKSWIKKNAPMLYEAWARGKGESPNPNAVNKDNVTYNTEVGSSADKLGNAAKTLTEDIINNKTTYGGSEKVKEKGDNKSLARCATAVSEAVRQAYGVNLKGDAWEFAEQLANNDKFTELEGYNEKSMGSLPKGAIVVQDKNNKHKWGHTFIAGGDGKGYSDFRQDKIQGGYGQMRVFMPKDSVSLNGEVQPVNQTDNSTQQTAAVDNTTSTKVTQQTDDGVRDALLTFAAANKKDRENQRTRNLIFQATDVTGSLGCWGITQINNIGGPMRH